MSLDAVAGLLVDALWVSLCVSGPILVLTTVIGLCVSLLQALTQVNESSIAFVAKMVGGIAIILVSGTWMLATLVSFVTRTIESGIR